MRETRTADIGRKLNFGPPAAFLWNGRGACVFIGARSEFLGSLPRSHMRSLLLPLLLLSAASSYGTLAPATGRQLTDYSNWFAPFRVASDANVTGIPNPRADFPDSTEADTVNRDWSGFSPNWGTTGLVAPTFGVTKPITVEVVFLGESGGWWNDFGYRLNGVDYLLVDGVQAVGGRTISFGYHTFLTIDADDALDFFITGSGVKKQDGKITIGDKGGKFYTYDKTLNTGGAVQQSYYGTLDPLKSTRVVADLGSFTVLGFEDYNLTTGQSDRDYNDLLFAFRYVTETPVPEPATYGVLAAGALLGLVVLKRRHRSA
jgi:hypothetical protein